MTNRKLNKDTSDKISFVSGHCIPTTRFGLLGVCMKFAIKTEV